MFSNWLAQLSSFVYALMNRELYLQDTQGKVINHSVLAES